VEFIPKHAFVDFALDPKIQKNIAKKGYILPTPIQDHAIPHVLEGVDVVGIANTGTGKTAAFLASTYSQSNCKTMMNKFLLLCLLENLQHKSMTNSEHFVVEWESFLQ
jgi:superfamily II DNA/RNA helicase